MAKEVIVSGDAVAAGLGMANQGGEGQRAPGFEADFELVSPNGKTERWHWKNTVTGQGRADLLNRQFGGKAAASWRMGLMGTSTTGASSQNSTDSLSSHNWPETAGYGNSNDRISIAGFASTKSAGTDTMMSGTAQFVFYQAANIGGAFICDQQSTNGNAGVLYSVGSYSATRGVASGDTLNATVSLSMS